MIYVYDIMKAIKNILQNDTQLAPIIITITARNRRSRLQCEQMPY